MLYWTWPDFASHVSAAFFRCQACDTPSNVFEFRKTPLSCCDATNIACIRTVADYNKSHAAVQHQLAMPYWQSQISVSVTYFYLEN
jgi:hypothetical protein